ncbi:hypothetical protein SLS57_004316 [Botryosphaeria dothidea]
MSDQSCLYDKLVADLPLPKDADDADDAPLVSFLTTLFDTELSLLLPTLIPLLTNWHRKNLRTHLLTRASHAGPTSPITQTLTTLLLDASPSTIPLRTTLIAGIIEDLPLRRLPPYRPTLARIAAAPPPADAEKRHLASTATALLRLLAGEAWAPADKQDNVAIRALSAHARSPEAMAPHVRDLLGWLEDVNWPPFRACAAQLARFPGAVVGEARRVLREEKDDDEWRRNVLRMVMTELPGEVREGFREDVVELLREIEGRVEAKGEGEDEWDLREEGREYLDLMDRWKGRETVLGRVGWYWEPQEWLDEDEAW